MDIKHFLKIKVHYYALKNKADVHYMARIMI